MIQAQTKKAAPTTRRTAAGSAQGRTLLLVLVCFLLGLAAGAYWIHRVMNRNPASPSGAGGALSESTEAALKQLVSPVEIRFYSLLDPATTSDALRDFAERVNQLTAEYEREAGGKIKVSRQTTRSDAAAQAAAADGIKAFNLDKGDACFLGLAVAGNGQRETLGQLSPDWEAALESDLSRAILRVADARPAAKSAAMSAAPVDATVIAEVKRSIPDLDSVSLPEATQTLRVAALKEIMAVTDEMQRRVREAQQRISQAQSSGSEAEQQAALKQLQQVQAEQAERVKQISARTQAQIQALQQIKQK